MYWQTTLSLPQTAQHRDSTCRCTQAIKPLPRARGPTRSLRELWINSPPPPPPPPLLSLLVKSIVAAFYTFWTREHIPQLSHILHILNERTHSKLKAIISAFSPPDLPWQLLVLARWQGSLLCQQLSGHELCPLCLRPQLLLWFSAGRIHRCRFLGSADFRGPTLQVQVVRAQYIDGILQDENRIILTVLCNMRTYHLDDLSWVHLSRRCKVPYSSRIARKLNTLQHQNR